jgi:hypothetical protein
MMREEPRMTVMASFVRDRRLCCYRFLAAVCFCAVAATRAQSQIVKSGPYTRYVFGADTISTRGDTLWIAAVEFRGFRGEGATQSVYRQTRYVIQGDSAIGVIVSGPPVQGLDPSEPRRMSKQGLKTYRTMMSQARQVETILSKP